MQPNPSKSISVVVFGSGTGTNLQALLRYQQLHARPLFEVKAIVADRTCNCLNIAKEYHIPVILNSYKEFAALHSGDKNNLEVRILYDKKTTHLLDELAFHRQFSIDLIVLAGYMRLVSKFFLDHYNYQVINVHPGDLQKVDEHGKRKYVGSHAVFNALMAGESRTRSTVIQVDHDVDSGPILAFGQWVDYTEGYPVTKEKALKHQEKQKRESDWPVLIQAVEKISKNRKELSALKKDEFLSKHELSVG